MLEENGVEEKSLFERIGGSANDNSTLIQRVAGYAPWLVVIGKKDKQKTYSWHKKNLRIVIAGIVILFFIAVIWDQSGSNGKYTNAETNKFMNPTDIQIQQNALPSVNPAEIKSNEMPSQLGL